jgi:ABC-type branched-subunit amino acid transport system ATPase component
MVAIARGLTSRPHLLLLDESSLGLAPLVVLQVYRVSADIRRKGTTVLLVEQYANMALSVADRGYVLETGEIVVEVGLRRCGTTRTHRSEKGNSVTRLLPWTRSRCMFSRVIILKKLLYYLL